MLSVQIWSALVSTWLLVHSLSLDFDQTYLDTLSRGVGGLE